ncbi:hypothetical protein P9B58_15600 [Bacillus mojavensis]|nr:hypothetical protein [Bacillus mojavensis]MEC1291614.1 hypothetical protein [Bacillus mojavensis]MEC1705160.1 hypothetical protein [Bacillus mojavensis]MEC5247400.1 hypothetical protein [Bacillus mojavensis]
MKKIFFVGAIVAGFLMSSVGINSVSAEEINPIDDHKKAELKR